MQAIPAPQTDSTDLEAIKYRTIHECPELAAKCRVLILFVSTPTIVPEVFGFRHNERQLPTEAELNMPRTFHARICETVNSTEKIATLIGGDKSLLADIDEISKAGFGGWNWQQLMRAMREMPNLETIYLLGSLDGPGYKKEPLNEAGERPEIQPGFVQKPRSGKGSYDYVGLCRALLSEYLPKIVDRTPVDFENFNDLSLALHTIIKQVRSGAKPDEILLDITGGQKIASIAGAALTLNNELRFQYVQTNYPFKNVPYDLVMSQQPSLEPHE